MMKVLMAFLGMMLASSLWAGRVISFAQMYAVNPCWLSNMGLNITNISGISQTVRVNGGMQVLLDHPDGVGTGAVEGTFIAGWWIRGSSVAGVTSPTQGAVASPVSGPLCSSAAAAAAANSPPTINYLCSGIGTDRSPAGSTSMNTDGPSFILAPGASVFIQSGRYGSGAHGIYRGNIVVDEDRGALSASGYLGGLEINCSDGNSVIGTGTNTAVPINGGRPF